MGGAVVILYLFLLPTLQSVTRWASGNPWSVWLLSAGLIVGLAADVTYGYQRTFCPSPSELITISRRASHVLGVAGTSWSQLPHWCR
jgi:hypothetical protein